MTVNELLRTTTSAELSEWMAYFQLEREQDQPSEEEALRKMFNAYG
jgi:hypothetical protein